jgi:hypothetical protein
MSGDEGLWGELPEQRAPEPAARGAPRLRRPERHQLGWPAAAIDDLVAPDHPVRAVWAFVDALDLSELHDEVKAREGVPGQAPPDPALMLPLWLFATVEGVGSARQLDRLCDQHLAHRWLCGGVSTNSHTLNDFRIAHAEALGARGDLAGRGRLGEARWAGAGRDEGACGGGRRFVRPPPPAGGTGSGGEGAGKATARRGRRRSVGGRAAQASGQGARGASRRSALLRRLSA